MSYEMPTALYHESLNFEDFDYNDIAFTWKSSDVLSDLLQIYREDKLGELRLNSAIDLLSSSKYRTNEHFLDNLLAERKLAKRNIDSLRQAYGKHVQFMWNRVAQLPGGGARTSWMSCGSSPKLAVPFSATPYLVSCHAYLHSKPSLNNPDQIETAIFDRGAGAPLPAGNLVFAPANEQLFDEECGWTAITSFRRGKGVIKMRDGQELATLHSLSFLRFSPEADQRVRVETRLERDMRPTDELSWAVPGDVEGTIQRSLLGVQFFPVPLEDALLSSWESPAPSFNTLTGWGQGIPGVVAYIFEPPTRAREASRLSVNETAEIPGPGPSDVQARAEDSISSGSVVFGEHCGIFQVRPS